MPNIFPFKLCSISLMFFPMNDEHLLSDRINGTKGCSEMKLKKDTFKTIKLNALPPL